MSTKQNTKVDQFDAVKNKEIDAKFSDEHGISNEFICKTRFFSSLAITDDDWWLQTVIKCADVLSDEDQRDLSRHILTAAKSWKDSIGKINK